MVVNIGERESRVGVASDCDAVIANVEPQQRVVFATKHASKARDPSGVRIALFGRVVCTDSTWRRTRHG